MADQAAVSPENGRRVRINSPVTEGVFGNLAELGGDIASLAELQVQLAAADAKESLGRAILPAILLGAGVVFLLAALPVALIGVSMLLADALGLTHPGWAYLIVAGVTAALTVVLVLIGLPRLSHAFASFIRTKEELSRNVAWIKTVLANSGRPPAHHRRV